MSMTARGAASPVSTGGEPAEGGVRKTWSGSAVMWRAPSMAEQVRYCDAPGKFWRGRRAGQSGTPGEAGGGKSLALKANLPSLNLASLQRVGEGNWKSS